MIRSKKILKILTILLIIFVSVCTFTGCGKKEDNNDEQAYKEPIINYFDGLKEKNLDKVLSAFPDFMGMSKNITMTEIDELYTYYEKQYGNNINISYEFGDAVALGEEELKELEDEAKSAYPEAGDIDFTAGYTVTIKVTVSGSGATEKVNEDGSEENNENNNGGNAATDTVENQMYSIQYNGKWCIL